MGMSFMALRKIHRVSPSEQAFEQLRKMILEGEWQPGERLPSEHDLAASLGVSRISVRQAIMKLSTMGLLETKWGEGNFVRELDAGLYVNDLLPLIYLNKDSTRHIWEFRMVIEVEGAYLAANRITEERLEYLREKIQEMDQLQGDVDNYTMADFEFHCAIIEATENPIFIQTATVLKDVLMDSITTLTRVAGESDGLYYHKKILEALENRDAKLTQQMMRAHLQSAYSLYCECLKRNGQLV